MRENLSPTRPFTATGNMGLRLWQSDRRNFRNFMRTLSCWILVISQHTLPVFFTIFFLNTFSRLFISWMK